jgi:hypothetical protein
VDIAKHVTEVLAGTSSVFCRKPNQSVHVDVLLSDSQTRSEDDSATDAG